MQCVAKEAVFVPSVCVCVWWLKVGGAAVVYRCIQPPSATFHVHVCMYICIYVAYIANLLLPLLPAIISLTHRETPIFIQQAKWFTRQVHQDSPPPYSLFLIYTRCEAQALRALSYICFFNFHYMYWCTTHASCGRRYGYRFEGILKKMHFVNVNLNTHLFLYPSNKGSGYSYATVYTMHIWGYIKYDMKIFTKFVLTMTH